MASKFVKNISMWKKTPKLVKFPQVSYSPPLIKKPKLFSQLKILPGQAPIISLDRAESAESEPSNTGIGYSLCFEFLHLEGYTFRNNILTVHKLVISPVLAFHKLHFPSNRYRGHHHHFILVYADCP